MKKAFTMLELIFVIIVMGIILAVVTPNTRNNPTAEAVTELLSQIRYAQHLAMTDDKYDANDATWVQDRWQISIEDNNLTIVSDNGTRLARNIQDSSVPLSRDYAKKYDVTITAGSGCTAANPFYLSFDHLGRPLLGDLNNYTAPVMATANERLLTSVLGCVLTVAGNGVSYTITVAAETGYAMPTF